MVSAIILAGYNKHEVSQYKAALRRGDEFVQEYKPLAEFKDYSSGTPVSKPLIQFTFDCLQNVQSIDDIVIVGDSEKLNGSLGHVFKEAKKPVKVIDQEENLDTEFIDTLGITKSGIPYGTLCENALKAYSRSNAYQTRNGALFFTADTPLIRPGRVGEFLLQLREVPENAALVYPIVAMDKELMSVKRLFRRGYFYMKNDTQYKLEDGATTRIGKRQGFRVSAYAYVNPFNINLYQINVAYSMRKMENWGVRKNVASTLISSGLLGIVWKYFSRTLKVTDVEEAVTKLIANKGSRVIIIPNNDILSTYDYDALRREKTGLKWLMRRAHLMY